MNTPFGCRRSNGVGGTPAGSCTKKTLHIGRDAAPIYTMLMTDMKTQPDTDRQVSEVALVERAQRGDRESLNELAQIARERLRVYVYRLTLKDDLAQDIVQESLLEMCKILGKLKKTDRFWSWLYGIANNKLHRHYRTEKAMRNAAASEERRRGPRIEREEGFEGLVGEELKQIVSNAMQKLRTRYKAVLVMRCYDGMSYAEIAESMGSSEFGTRMLFVRAKKALQKELLHNGFHKGSLLGALIVFGKMTAPSEAAAAQLTVPAAALKVGLAAGVATVATSSTGIVSVATVGALTVGTVVSTSGPKPDAASLRPSSVSSQAASSYATPSEATTQYWYYFPEGADGPIMLRAQSRAGKNGRPMKVLQNTQANYVYENGIVQVNNRRMWLDDLSVFKLPTDSTALRGFLAQVEGVRNDIQPVSTRRDKGLFVVLERNEQGADSAPWTLRAGNVLEEDHFQSDWPTNAQIVDNRDAMHKRQWAYFRVRGRVAGQDVRGTGRLPFVYAACWQHSAWLNLKVGNAATLTDGGSAAFLRDAGGEIRGRYAKGSFFRGLSRPWMGLHTLDTVRRDAAEQRARFETRLLPKGRRAEVTIISDETRLVYTIDVEADLVRQIDFFVAATPVGSLEFEYLEDTNVSRSEFAAPTSRNQRMTVQGDQGILWLVRLANGTLGR